MIIDAHCHLGRDVVYDFEVTESRLLGTMAENGIGGAIVQPCIARPYLEDTRAAHDGYGGWLRSIRILGRTITAPSCGAV